MLPFKSRQIISTSTKRWIDRSLYFHIFREPVSNSSSVCINIGAILIHVGDQINRFHSIL